MDAAAKHENRYRAVIEYANGAMFNVAELDAWAVSNKAPISFQKLLVDDGIKDGYDSTRHFVPFEILSTIIAWAIVPEDADPHDARAQLMAAHEHIEPDDPVSRLRDLVMVRYDRQLLSAVFDGDLSLYDTLTMSRIDIGAARMRYDAEPEAYVHAAQARLIDTMHGAVTAADIERAKNTLEQKFARLDHMAWAIVILTADAPPHGGEERYRQILSITRWIQALGLPFRHANGLPASEPKGVAVTGTDVRECQYLAVEDVRVAALRADCWPEKDKAEPIVDGIFLARAAVELAIMEVGEERDGGIIGACEKKWQAVIDHLLKQRKLPLLARHIDGETQHFQPTIEPQSAWVDRDELRRVFASPPHEAIEEFERNRQQEVEEAATEKAARRAEGRYTLREAAIDIARDGRAEWYDVLDKLKTAWDSGKLAVFEPGSTLLCTSSSLHFSCLEAYWNDLNAWLESNEPHTAYRFIGPPVPAQTDAGYKSGDGLTASNGTNSPSSPIRDMRKPHGHNWPLLTPRPVALPNVPLVAPDWMAREIAFAMLEIPDDWHIVAGKKEVPAGNGTRRDIEPLVSADYQLVRDICGSNPPMRGTRADFKQFEARFNEAKNKPIWNLRLGYQPSNTMVRAQNRHNDIYLLHREKLAKWVHKDRLSLITPVGGDTTDIDKGGMRITDAKAYLDQCCIAWEVVSVAGHEPTATKSGKGMTHIKPNWSVWHHMLKASLSDAVCLSCNVNPGAATLNPIQHGIAHLLGLDFVGWDVTREIAERLSIARSHAGTGGTLPTLTGDKDGEVYLATFAEWAVNTTKWTVPDELRALAGSMHPAVAQATTAPPEQEPTKAAARRPLKQQAHQEAEILRVIRELSHDPKKLPKQKPGKPGVKAAVRERLSFSKKVFDKAWDRLRASGDVADNEHSPKLG